MHTYRPEIDGLRAISVLAVILFHAKFGIPGGYVGVDVFFVISGYLIAGLLARDLDAGTFSLTTFWERRVRRILPASLAMTAVVFVVALAIMMPGPLKQFAESVIAQATLLANVFFWRNFTYFDGRGETRPLLHMWSLAVEEQYYLLFPLCLAALWRRGRGAVLAVLILLTAASFALSAVGVHTMRSSTFYLLPGRAWELLLGAILAIIPTTASRRVVALRDMIGFLGLTAILGACLGFNEATPFPGPMAAIPCVGAVALLWSQEQGLTTVGRLLAWSPLRGVGLLSYSLYLWHWPVLALMRIVVRGDLTPADIVAALSLTAALSYVSWRTIETPFRGPWGQLGGLPTIARGAGLSVGLAGLAVGVLFLQGIPSRFPDRILAIATASKAPDSQSPDLPGGFRQGHQFPTIGSTATTAPLAPFLLWGDSHAEVVSPLFHNFGIDTSTRVPVAINHGAAPLIGVWQKYQDARQRNLKQQVVLAITDQQPSDVFLVARWSMHIAEVVDSESEGIAESDSRAAFGRGVAATIAALKAAGVERIWIGLEVPRQDLTPGQIALRALYLGADPRTFGIPRELHAARQHHVRAVFEAYRNDPAVRFLDLGDPCFAPDGIAYAQTDDGSMYLDDDHLSLLGAVTYLGDTLMTVLGNLATTHDEEGRQSVFQPAHEARISRTTRP